METKKLTAKDLMIGDWVNIAKPHKVTGIQICDGIICVQTDYTDTYCSIENYEPIPLTAEVLEKNGWTKPASGRVWSRNNVPSFVLEEIDDGSFEVTTDTCSEWGGLCVIRYVHVFQHVLRLCGVDKEITL